MTSKLYVITVGLFFPLILTACGGGSSSNGNQPVGMTVLQGQFIDSAVDGLNYITATQQGMTNAAGEFNYLAGETITFSIGDIEFPPVLASAVITPLTVAATTDINNITAVNIARLLQSLDTDAEPSNGITIDTQAHSVATGLSIDFDSPDFDTLVINLVANSGSDNVVLISAEDAISHLGASLGLETGCGTTHPMVGFTTNLSSIAHSVSGVATIVDDCTIEITHFNYDGGGLPDVFIYGGLDGDYTDGFAIGDNLFGTAINNQTLTIPLVDETVLDSLNGISVWCVSAGVSFGEGVFQAP